jgi:galactose mutarotase-like enzyme
LKSSSAPLKNDVVREILRVDFENFPYLGIWAKPQAPYVCIEPWIGIADHVDSNREFITKERLIILDAGAEQKFSYSVTIL